MKPYLLDEEEVLIVIQRAFVEAANVVEFENEGGKPHAFCPLCGQGPYWSTAFAWPEGLRRHFTGRGNQPQCCVMEEIEQTVRRKLQAIRD